MAHPCFSASSSGDFSPGRGQPQDSGLASGAPSIFPVAGSRLGQGGIGSPWPLSLQPLPCLLSCLLPFGFPWPLQACARAVHGPDTGIKPGSQPTSTAQAPQPHFLLPAAAMEDTAGSRVTPRWLRAWGSGSSKKPASAPPTPTGLPELPGSVSLLFTP